VLAHGTHLTDDLRWSDDERPSVTTLEVADAIIARLSD
jgi:hypothetical protein